MFILSNQSSYLVPISPKIISCSCEDPTPQCRSKERQHTKRYKRHLHTSRRKRNHRTNDRHQATKKDKTFSIFLKPIECSIDFVWFDKKSSSIFTKSEIDLLSISSIAQEIKWKRPQITCNSSDNREHSYFHRSFCSEPSRKRHDSLRWNRCKKTFNKHRQRNTRITYFTN